MTHREEMVRTEMTGSGRESFVLRVWLEEPVRAGRRAPWRGRIIHVPSSAELHSGDLGRIFGFVAEHLDRMGARLPLPRRLALWLSRRIGRRPARRGADEQATP